MDSDAMRSWLLEHAEWTTTRASGPGGQHVNKTSSAVLCRFNLAELEGVTEAERAWLLERLSGRLTTAGELVLRAQDSRSQLRNREDLLERAISLIEKALVRPKTRRPTRPSKAAKKRRLESKSQQAQKKAGRRSPLPE